MSATAEEGSVKKNTIFVGGVTEDTDESALYELFSTFGTAFHLSPSVRLLLTMPHHSQET